MDEMPKCPNCDRSDEVGRDEMAEYWNHFIDWKNHRRIFMYYSCANCDGYSFREDDAEWED